MPAGRGHWIAPDLIGMGASDKPVIGYRLADHVAYVDEFVSALGLTDLVLIGHDWGVAIALELFGRSARPVRGIAFTEGHLRPLSGWDAFDAGGRELFQQLRTPGTGERMVLDENFFIETLLPAGLNGSLPAEAMEHYRAPYPNPSSRRPLLQWAREIPIAGEPTDVAASMQRAADNLVAARVPTLLVHGDPGVLIDPAAVAWCREQLTDLTVAEVGGPAGHFLPADRPDHVADALISWVDQLP